MTIDLDFRKRVVLMHLLGSARPINLKQAYNLLQVFSAVRLSEDEQRMANMTVDKSGQVSWDLPNDDPAFGRKVIELDADQARDFAAHLEESQPPTIFDAGWMMEIVKELRS